MPLCFNISAVEKFISIYHCHGIGKKFPESTHIAYLFDALASSRESILRCNVQLTKDVFWYLSSKNKDGQLHDRT